MNRFGKFVLSCCAALAIAGSAFAGPTSNEVEEARLNVIKNAPAYTARSVAMAQLGLAEQASQDYVANTTNPEIVSREQQYADAAQVEAWAKILREAGEADDVKAQSLMTDESQESEKEGYRTEAMRKRALAKQAEMLAKNMRQAYKPGSSFCLQVAANMAAQADAAALAALENKRQADLAAQAAKNAWLLGQANQLRSLPEKLSIAVNDNGEIELVGHRMVGATISDVEGTIGGAGTFVLNREFDGARAFYEYSMNDDGTMMCTKVSDLISQAEYHAILAKRKAAALTEDGQVTDGSTATGLSGVKNWKNSSKSSVRTDKSNDPITINVRNSGFSMFGGKSTTVRIVTDSQYQKGSVKCNQN